MNYTQGKTIEATSIPSYNNKLRFQWLLNGELFYLFSRPKALAQVVKGCFISKNDIWWDDPLPHIFQLLLIIEYLFYKIVPLKR